MSVTPHGWLIPGSLAPEDYDEDKIAHKCGGVYHCTGCYDAFISWITDKLLYGRMTQNEARERLGLKPNQKSSKIRGMTPHVSIIDELSDNPIIELHLDSYDKENMARARMGLDPITSVTLHHWGGLKRPPAHFELMSDGTIKDNTEGLNFLTKHANSTSAVEHPAHYNMYEGVEIIDLVEQMNFNKGNAVKYITRAEFKGHEVQDLEKAVYYLKKELKRIKRKAKKKAKAEAKKNIRYVGDVNSLGLPVNRYSGSKG